MTARIERTTLVQTGAGAREHAEAHAERFRAPFSLRCGAFLIDYIILIGPVAFSTIIARMLGGGARAVGNTTESVGIIIALILSLLNFIVLTAWRGQTVGKWVTGLRIERDDGTPIGWLQSLVRHLVGYPLSFVTLCIGFIMAAFNARGLTLHDIIARTVVVRKSGRVRRRARGR